MESVSLYSEARNEYTKQMATWVVPQLVEFFRKEYDRIGATEGKRVMAAFQNWCAEVPRWNRDVIDANVNELLDNCKCDYIEDLMTAVFIAHTKMLTAIRVSNRHKKLQITLPKLDHFLHRVFVECARAFWKAPFLFADNVSLIERQKNLLQAETMCVEALSGAVRSLLPIKNILRDNLVEEESDASSEEEPVRHKKHKKKAKKAKYVSDSSSSSSSSEDEVETTAVPVKQNGGSSSNVNSNDAVVSKQQIDTDESSDMLEEMPVDPTPVFTLAAPAAPVAHVAPAATLEPEPPAPSVPEVIVQTTHELATEPAAEILTAEPVQQSTPKPVSATRESKVVELIKDDTLAAPANDVIIDTEPTVKFSPYEMVYDENSPDVSEMRYAPKMSIEEMPDKPPYEPVYAPDDDYDEDMPRPRISFGSGEVSLSGSDVDGDDVMALDPSDFETIA